MTLPTNRRQFLTTLAGTSTAGFLQPIYADHHAKKTYTIGLSQYSLHRTIRKGELKPLDYPDFVKKTFGLTDIDVWEGTFPKESAQATDAFTSKLRKRADEAGSKLFLLMVGAVNASLKEAAKREANVAGFTPWLDRAQTLGCRYVRIFLKALDDDTDEAINLAVDSLTKLSDVAQKRKLTLAIEPGASQLTRRGDWLAKLMVALKHPNCKLMPDFGKFFGNDIYEGTKAMMPHTGVISAKSHDFDEQGNEVKFDYPRLMKIAKEAEFTGIVAIEYEGSKLPEIEGIKATQALLKRLQ